MYRVLGIQSWKWRMGIYTFLFIPVNQRRIVVFSNEPNGASSRRPSGGRQGSKSKPYKKNRLTVFRVHSGLLVAAYYENNKKNWQGVIHVRNQANLKLTYRTV